MKRHQQLYIAASVVLLVYILLFAIGIEFGLLGVVVIIVVGWAAIEQSRFHSKK